MRGKSTPSLHLSVDSLLQVTYSLIIISVLFYKGSNHLVYKKETMQWIKAFCVPFSCLFFLLHSVHKYWQGYLDAFYPMTCILSIFFYLCWFIHVYSLTFKSWSGWYWCSAEKYKINLVTKAGVVFDIADLRYDVSTGIFTAPNSGIYVFDRTILSWQGQYAYTSYAL